MACRTGRPLTMPADPPAPNDPRVRLAAERTLLAWVRTGLSLMGFGFVVARFGLFLRELAAVRPDLPHSQGATSQWVGVVLVLLGTSALVYAAAEHRSTTARIARGEPLAAGRDWAGIVLAGLLAVLGLFIAAYLLFVTH
jgi:putative membrane protein